MFENIQRGTEYVLMAIPMDKLDYSVEENTATIEDLAFHISTLPLGAALFAQNLFDKFPESDQLMAEFKKYLGDSLDDKNYPEIFRKSCKVFTDFFEGKEDWYKTYTSFLFRGERTYLEGFLSMQNHLLQHRGSLTTTLRSMGIPVSMKQYWGMKPLH